MDGDDERLLRECDVETFVANAAVDNRDGAVRLTHRPSGIVVSCWRGSTSAENCEHALALLRERLAE